MIREAAVMERNYPLPPGQIRLILGKRPWICLRFGP